jgi:hypothetical protein
MSGEADDFPGCTVGEGKAIGCPGHPGSYEGLTWWHREDEDCPTVGGDDLALAGWRYTPSGKVRHLTTVNLFDGTTRETDCGLASRPEWWRGTGSQDEYDTLALLRPCERCRP